MAAASKGLWGALNCLVGRHVRSRGHAKSFPHGWISRCGRCGIPMVKAHGGGKWKVVKYRRPDPEQIAADGLDPALADAIARSANAGVRAKHKKAEEVYD